jgi:hypothetical protein
LPKSGIRHINQHAVAVAVGSFADPNFPALTLKIHIGQLLPAAVPYDERGINILNGPRRRLRRAGMI